MLFKIEYLFILNHQFHLNFVHFFTFNPNFPQLLHKIYTGNSLQRGIGVQ